MVSASDIKFYLSNNNGLGGGIDTSQEVISTQPNNLFTNIGEAQRVAGSTKYGCIYIKNLSTETAKQVKFMKKSGSAGDHSTMWWAKGITGKNGSEPSIANDTTAPTGVTDWKGTGEEVLLGDLAQNDRYGLWFKAITVANAPIMRSNQDVFQFKFTNPTGGTGTDPDPSGGGTGSTGGNSGGTISDWSIGIVGDMDGTSSRTDTVMNMLEKYDKCILVGDYAYGDPDDWTNKADNHDLKPKILGFAYGNHEYDDGVSDYKSWYGNSSTYFMKIWRNVAVITIDSNINMDEGSTQWNKVKTFLDQAKNNSVVDWIFCTMHHPWFGSGSDHGYNDDDQVQAFHDLFTDYKVAFVFTGHNHNWQRSHKVKYNSSDPEEPNVTDSSSPFTNDTNGLIHVVSGTGGHDSESALYDLDDAIGSGGNPNAFQNKNNLGIYEIKATNGGKTLTCKFVATDGDTFDTITYTAT